MNSAMTHHCLKNERDCKLMGARYFSKSISLTWSNSILSTTFNPILKYVCIHLCGKFSSSFCFFFCLFSFFFPSFFVCFYFRSLLCSHFLLPIFCYFCSSFRSFSYLFFAISSSIHFFLLANHVTFRTIGMKLSLPTDTLHFIFLNLDFKPM